MIESDAASFTGSPVGPDAAGAPPPMATPAAPAASQVHYVGFWARVLAWLIDLPIGVVAIVLVSMLVDPHHTTAHQAGAMQFTLEYLVPGVAILAFWFTRGATPGKMVVSAVIVDEKTLGTPTRQQLILRLLGYLVSTSVVLLGYLWIAFDARKQGWHDKIAGTVVIRRPRGR